MIENDPLKSLILYHKNTNPENDIVFPEKLGSYGMTAFLVRSLEKLKQNTESEALKKLIDTYIGEYLLHIKDFHHTYEMAEIPVRDPAFIFYAKTAYNKVVKQEECLNRLLNTLERNNIENM